MNIVQQLTKELQAATAHTTQLEALASEALALLDEAEPGDDVEDVAAWYANIAALKARFASLTRGGQ